MLITKSVFMTLSKAINEGYSMRIELTTAEISFIQAYNISNYNSLTRYPDDQTPIL